MNHDDIERHKKAPVSIGKQYSGIIGRMGKHESVFLAKIVGTLDIRCTHRKGTDQSDSTR
jgi:hypothetical protein